jgi:hypothetical protein
MALKQATVTFTKSNGETVTRVLSIKDVVFRYQDRTIETIYTAYPSEEARLRGANPEYMSQLVDMNLTNEEDLAMLLTVSARLWEINSVAPLINDYTELDDNGKQILKLKSLDELEAIIEDVEA